MQWTWANRITVMRLVAVPVFIWVLWEYRQALPDEVLDHLRWTALAIFIAAALSDVLDGYLARKHDQVTFFGSVADPAADRALMLSAMVLMSTPWPGLDAVYFPLWFTACILGRELVMLTGAVIVRWVAGHIQVRPRITGKLATFLQGLVIVWCLSQGAEAPFKVLLWFTVVTTLFSGVRYVVDGIHQGLEGKKLGAKSEK